MTHSQFSLAWDEYKRNICNGLSSLQQNGEFVDMTLAADGHFVKVHQVIVALASPFIKELITSAQCPHPVVFLNKISYSTLCSILEYIYTGEVLVSIENLNELIEAGRELHINGLENMKLHQSLPKAQPSNNMQSTMDDIDEEVCYFEVSQRNEDDQSELDFDNQTLVCNQKAIKIIEDTYDDNDLPEEEIEAEYEMTSINCEIPQTHNQPIKNIDPSHVKVMQYTVSNQGSLQMILNRFIYYLKHTNRNNSRQWRCVDYVSNIKCPAHVITKDDIVVQRIAAHTHPFHDKRILKKVRAGAIFSAIQEAEREGSSKRRKISANGNDGESE